MRLALAAMLVLAAAPAWARRPAVPKPTPKIDGNYPPPKPARPMELTDPVTGEKRRISWAKPVIDLYPATDSIFANAPPRLWWKASENGAKYRVEIAGDGDFKSIVSDRTVASSEAPTGSLRPGRYYWRVQAQDKFGAPAEWSTVSDFEVRGAIEKAPATLKWRPERLVGTQYRVQVSDNAKFDRSIVDKSTETAFLVTDPLPRGTYFWRVTAIDPEGKKASPSAAKRFVVAEGGIVTYEGGQ